MNIFDVIEIHNKQIEKMQDLAQSLVDTFPNVDNTPVNEAFCNLYEVFAQMAILLCCEANSEDPDSKWATSEAWHVMSDDEFDNDNEDYEYDEDCDCENCEFYDECHSYDE